MGVKLEHTRTPGLSVETVEKGRELGLSFMTLSFCQISLRQGTSSLLVSQHVNTQCVLVSP